MLQAEMSVRLYVYVCVCMYVYVCMHVVVQCPVGSTIHLCRAL